LVVTLNVPYGSLNCQGFIVLSLSSPLNFLIRVFLPYFLSWSSFISLLFAYNYRLL